MTLYFLDSSAIVNARVLFWELTPSQTLLLSDSNTLCMLKPYSSWRLMTFQLLYSANAASPRRYFRRKCG